MAEQEACADVVAKSKEESGARVEGESLLLPLLQGLLDAPDGEQTADSGTESGEDLRSGLLAEVQNVLAKLANSLKSESSEMAPEKRSSLLQLVTRLQNGLTATQLSSGERRSSAQGQGRFARRRRQNRHTVGVTSEELEDARKLMEEFGLCHNLTAKPAEKPAADKLPLQKQNSEGSVLQNNSQFKSTTTQNKTTVKNAVAKPYGSSTSTSQSQSGTSSTVDTPTEVSESIEFPFPSSDLKPPDNSLQRETPPLQQTRTNPNSKKPETVSSSFNPETKTKLNSKSDQYAKTPLQQFKSENCESTQESETDEDTLKGKTESQLPTAKETESSLMLQNNPIYSKPKTPEPEDKLNNRFNTKKLKMKRANTIDIPKPLDFYETEDDYDSDTSMLGKHNSRINNYLALRGPIRVGRNLGSNTNLPVFEPKTESDRKFMAFINKHNESSGKASLWAQNHLQSNDRSGANWNNRFGRLKTTFEKAASTPSTPNLSSARNFWKTADDAAASGKPMYNGPKISKQGARNLQQMFESRDKQEKQNSTYSPSEEKNIVTGSLKVDTKGIDASRNYRFVPQPLPVNKFSHAPTSAFAAIPKKTPVQIVAQPSKPFSNQPLSTAQPNNQIFKAYTPSSYRPNNPPVNQPPIKPFNHSVPETLPHPPNISEGIVKSEYPETDSNNSTPLYLYSPKPLQTSPQGFSTDNSPSATPWTSNVNERRVQKLAASKFENVSRAPPEPQLIKPRRMSKEKAFAYQQPIQDNDKLTAPYLVKSVDKNSTVRKLSDQFNKAPPNSDSYSALATVKYGPANNYQDLSSYQPQNYSIVYPNSKHQSCPPKQIDNQYQSYQKFQQEQGQRHPQQTSSSVYQQKPQNRPEVNSHPTAIYQAQYTHPSSFKTKTSDYLPQPQNYSIRYNQSQKQNAVPKLYQEKTQKQPKEYTSQQFIQFNQPKPQPRTSLPVLDSSSSESSPIPERPQYQRQTSQDSVKEYEAAVTRVMKGPVSHQAVTVQQKSPKSRDEHDTEGAFNLKSVLQKFSQMEKNGQDVKKKPATNEILPERKLSIDSAMYENNKNAKAMANLQRTQSFKKPVESSQPNFLVNGKPLSMESTEINEDGESVITSKFHIPVVAINSKTQVSKHESLQMPSPTRQMLSKSDSWHQLMHEQYQAQQKTAGPVSRAVARSKSSHTLAVPTIQFQAGMTKDEVSQKKRSVEAYFSDKMSPQSRSKTPSDDDSVDKSDKIEVKSNKSSINRKKTSEKVSIHRHGVARSRTLPNLVCPDLLDESKVEESFEDLFKSNS